MPTYWVSYELRFEDGRRELASSAVDRPKPINTLEAIALLEAHLNETVAPTADAEVTLAGCSDFASGPGYGQMAEAMLSMEQVSPGQLPRVESWILDLRMIQSKYDVEAVQHAMTEEDRGRFNYPNLLAWKYSPRERYAHLGDWYVIYTGILSGDLWEVESTVLPAYPANCAAMVEQFKTALPSDSKIIDYIRLL